MTSNVLRSGTQSGIHVMLHGVKGRVDMEAALTSSGSEYILPTRLQIQGRLDFCCIEILMLKWSLMCVWQVRAMVQCMEACCLM